MYSVNENYLKLPGSYLFSNIAKKVAAFSAANPDAPIIRLGIGEHSRLHLRSSKRFTVQLMRWHTQRHSTDMHRILDMNF